MTPELPAVVQEMTREELLAYSRGLAHDRELGASFLRKYGRHLDTCVIARSQAPACSCGFAKALSLLERSGS